MCAVTLGSDVSAADPSLLVPDSSQVTEGLYGGLPDSSLVVPDSSHFGPGGLVDRSGSARLRTSTSR